MSKWEKFRDQLFTQGARVAFGDACGYLKRQPFVKFSSAKHGKGEKFTITKTVGPVGNLPYSISLCPDKEGNLKPYQIDLVRLFVQLVEHIQKEESKK